ncbi:MAG TPA: hypothetical protein VGM64_04545 [Lacunisphaera sp.]
MKTKLIELGHDCWQMLTEVPGWPDAPKKIRVRRAIPILLPCVLIALLMGWNSVIRDPAIRTERASQRALLDQEKELDALRLGVSDQQAAELSERAAQAGKQILKGATDLPPILDNFKKMANERHWEGNFQASDLSTEARQSAGPLNSYAVRAKLTAVPGDPDAFSALIALLDEFSSSEKRIDLTRLSIRADEQGRYTAELNLRLVGRNLDEKTAQ